MPTEPLKENFAEKLGGEIAAEYGSIAPPILRLLRAQPNPEERARAILGHPTAREQIGTVALHAPILLVDPILDILLEHQPAETSLNLPLDALPATVAREVLTHRLRILTAWVLGEESDPSLRLSELHESLLSHIHRRLQLSFSIIALGSLASGDLAPNSNLNLLLVAESKDAQRNDLETHALLGFFQGLRHYGLDTELAIQRIHGRLYVEHGGLSGLAVSTLTPAEFVALSLTRTLIGEPERTVEPTPMTPERLRSLAKHKRRLETEMVQPRYRRRNVKFGEGGLSDIEWLLLLNEARYPTATDRVRPGPLGAGPAHLWRTEDRIKKLAEAQLLTFIERDELIAAHRHGMEVRLRLFLLDFHPDVIPENPDKLLRLAMTMGFDEGNEFLRVHEEHLDAVRSIYTDSLERLRA